jgi:hypothetical protein
LTHYVVIAQDVVDAVMFARDAEFSERRFNRLTASLEFPDLGIALSLQDIYRDSGLGATEQILIHRGEQWCRGRG